MRGRVVSSLAPILLLLGAGWVVGDGVEDRDALDEWMVRLSDPVELRRAGARRDLRTLGEKAIPILRKGMGHSNYRVRLESVELFCELTGGDDREYLEDLLVAESAIPVCHVLLQQLIRHHEGQGVASIRHVLLRQTPVETWRLRERYQEVLSERVRELLVDLVSESGNYGYYRNQFERIVVLGKDTSVSLLRLVQDETADSRLRSLAAGALGDLGDRSVVRSLRTLYRLKSRSREHSLKNVLATTLAKLGDSQAMKESLDFYEMLIRVPRPSRDALFRCAYVNQRFGRNERALEVYGLLVSQYSGQGLAYYNIACIHSLRGDREKAFVALRQAFTKGYSDASWARRDRDLEVLWNDPRFEAILRGR